MNKLVFHLSRDPPTPTKTIFQEAHDEWHDIAGFLIGLYEQNIIPELMKVPLMDIKYTWARNMLQGSLFVFFLFSLPPPLSPSPPSPQNHCKNMLQGLDHLATFAGQQCNRKHATISKNLVQALKDESITPFKNQAIEQRKLQMAIKKQVDTKRLKFFPQTHIIKAALWQAMLDLMILANCYQQGSPTQIMAAATTIMVGIIYFNGYAGRSGEWQIMEKALVLGAMESSLEYLICQWHKTSYAYGDLA